MNNKNNLLNICFNFFVKLSNYLLQLLHRTFNNFNFDLHKNKTIKNMYDSIIINKENENKILSFKLNELKRYSSTLESKITHLDYEISDLESKIIYLEKNLNS